MTNLNPFLIHTHICYAMSYLQRFFSLRMAYLFALIALGYSTAMAQSEIVWVEGREYNFGEVRESDSMVSHRFVMRNGGNEPFSIVSAAPRCRCTKANFTPKVIEPGDTTSVLVTFYPRNRSGTFIQRVAVITTSCSRISYLFVKGNVVPDTNGFELLQPVSKTHE